MKTRGWHPGRAVVAAWMVLSVALSVAGLVLYAALYSAAHGVAEIRVEGRQVLFGLWTALGLTLILLVMHELVHGLVARLYGARPSYGVGLMHRVIPYLYCTAEGHEFTRARFAAVALAPAALISAVGAAWVAFLPLGGWLVLPLAVHLGGCIADLWVAALVSLQPPGTMVEDLGTGMRPRNPGIE